VVAPIRRVLICVVAVVLQYADPAGEIIPVCGLRWQSTRGEIAVVNIDSKNREETQPLTAHRAGAFAGVSAMHPSLLCVASISLMVDAED
jgi:hypothetical protein